VRARDWISYAELYAIALVLVTMAPSCDRYVCNAATDPKACIMGPSYWRIIDTEPDAGHR
jgi:hypothetical protein